MASVLNSHARQRLSFLIAVTAITIGTWLLLNPTNSNAAYNSTYYCQTAVPAHGGCGGHFGGGASWLNWTWNGVGYTGYGSFNICAGFDYTGIETAGGWQGDNASCTVASNQWTAVYISFCPYSTGDVSAGTIFQYDNSPHNMFGYETSGSTPWYSCGANKIGARLPKIKAARVRDAGRARIPKVLLRHFRLFRQSRAAGLPAKFPAILPDAASPVGAAIPSAAREVDTADGPAYAVPTEKGLCLVTDIAEVCTYDPLGAHLAVVTTVPSNTHGSPVFRVAGLMPDGVSSVTVTTDSGDATVGVHSGIFQMHTTSPVDRLTVPAHAPMDFSRQTHTAP